MSDYLVQAETLEAEFEQLAQAEELNDEGIAGVLERRDALHRKMVEAVEQNNELRAQYQPLFKRAYDNTQALLERCRGERDQVQERLITLNTSKKARKAY